MTSRERVLAGARREFALHGLAGARVHRIAERARVNKAMIYYHFDSKEKLYQAVLDELLSALKEFLEGALVRKDQDAEALFTELAQLYSTSLGASEDFAPIMLRELATGGERFVAAISPIADELHAGRRLRSIIDRGKRNGVFRRVDSTQALISFLGMNLFYILLARILDSIWEIKNENDFRRKRPAAVVDLFLYGLKAR